MATISLESLDLAALLCSRVCHDVISPVGAIVNGLEVLEDDNDLSMREFALELIGKSARQASARLQFARLAFGAAGSAGASIDLGDAEQVARGMFQDDKISFAWSAPRLLFPKNRVKLLLNLIMIAITAIPRGGSISANVSGDAEKCEFVLKRKGHQRPHSRPCRRSSRRAFRERHGRCSWHPGLLRRRGCARGRYDASRSASRATR